MYWFTVARRSPPSKIVSETLGPIDQNRLEMSKRCLKVELSNPPVALSVSAG